MISGRQGLPPVLSKSDRQRLQAGPGSAVGVALLVAITPPFRAAVNLATGIGRMLDRDIRVTAQAIADTAINALWGIPKSQRELQPDVE